MGQVNVNPPSSGPVVVNDGGFGAGMIIGIILLILIVLVLIFYAGPQIFRSGSSPAPSGAPTTAPTVAPTKTVLDTLYIA
jgi:Na+-transporting methylmalonyl-CoA/oxaloacetate decarboxylase gamma subunit